MELMISLLIFAVCACVCAAITAKAAADLNESRDLSSALFLSQNKAELIKSGNTQGGTEYFDADLTPSKQEGAVYSSVTALSPKEGGVTEYTVSIYRVSDNKLIYGISSAYYSE